MNATSRSTGRGCCTGSLFLKISVPAATFLAVAAIALVVIGHLQFHPLLLPGYSVAGVSGIIGLVSLMRHLYQKYIFSPTTPIGASTPISPSDVSQRTGENSGFTDTVILPEEVRIGSHVIEQVIPPQCVKLSPYDLKRLNIEPGTHVSVGGFVYKALSASEMRKGCIGLTLTQQFQVFGFNAQMPASASINGLVTPFRGQATPAGCLTMSVATHRDNEAFIYDQKELRQQLITQLKGDILKRNQYVKVTLNEGHELKLTVQDGINDGEYKHVLDETVVELKAEYSEDFISIDTVITIEKAMFSFELVSAVGTDGKVHFSTPCEEDEKAEQELLALCGVQVEPVEKNSFADTDVSPCIFPSFKNISSTLEKKIKSSKVGTLSSLKAPAFFSRKALWHVGEIISFDYKNVSYAVRLSKIDSENTAYSHALVGVINKMPRSFLLTFPN